MAKIVEMLGALLVGVLLFNGVYQLAKDFKPSEFGLGKFTHSFTNRFESEQISGFTEDADTLVQSLSTFEKQGKQTYLWLGASQIHSINKPQPGDRLAVTVANATAQSKGSQRRFVQLSEPNANLHELWALLHHTNERAKLNGVVLAMTYDDLNEYGIRDSVLPLYKTAPVDESQIDESRVAIGESELDARDTPQAWLEDLLVDWIEGGFEPFQKRSLIRSYIEASFKLGIVRLAFAVTKRGQIKIKPKRQAWNEEALDRIISYLQKTSVPLVIYKAPHQPGLVPFYHPRKAYDDYFKNLETRIASLDGVTYLDLETIVGQEHWGLSATMQPDVFHFTAHGHQLLGKAMDDAIEQLEVKNAVQ